MREHDISDLVDDIDAVVWEADPSTFQFTYVSRGAERLLGYPVAQWITEPSFWADHIHPEDRGAAVALCQAATSQGIDHDFEYRMLAADGSIRWVRDRVRVGTDLAGKTIRLRGVLFDKTVARKAEDALRESEQRFRAIFESTSAGIVILSLEGRIESSNRAAALLLGYTAQEMRGRNVLDLSHPNEREETARVLAAMAAGHRAVVDYQARYVHKLGNVVTALVSGALVPEPESGMPYLVAQLHDISERKALEHRLSQSQKLEAVGRLAGGVAHDFNNMLVIVQSYVEFLAADLLPGDPRRDDLNEIRKAADASADLTRQLLAFSRQQVIEPRVVSLNAGISNLQRLLERLIREDIKLVTRLSNSPLNVMIDPGQLEQVIVNLVVNARDAMPEGGSITVESSQVEPDLSESIEATDEMRGRFALLTITDTGTGMDAETQRRIFEPFFTTKPVGRGSGLGLATVYGIVRQNQGFITVQSEPGKGAAFQIYFPLVEGEAAQPQVAPGATDPRGSETVLLVEDAQAVRAAARQSLERYGYRVIEAASGPEALDIAAKYAGTIHLLLTDVVMPRMTGKQVAMRFQELRPHAHVLYMSGYTDDTIMRHGVLEPGIAYVAKPFGPLTLARKVRSVLEAVESSGGD